MKKLFLIPLVAVLAACTVVSAGTVEAKDYDPAWVQITPGYYSGSGTSRIWIPQQTTYWPEEWKIKLCAFIEDEKKCSWRDVSESFWNDTNVGDYVNLGEN